MTALGLAFFGAEGMRAAPLIDATLTLGPVPVTGQSLAVYAAAMLLIGALWFFFGSTIYGKALRATAVNRDGASAGRHPARAVGPDRLRAGRRHRRGVRRADRPADDDLL